ncbi:outer membrane beta-barrel protein [Mucilaginibacter sp. UYCu711]|uniref:outer membrane beta-barrel protein n=1 Tax=Mucilaginibacter sp. UYCu711 TaxID=3156339 RepID=UPI003D20C6E0
MNIKLKLLLAILVASMVHGTVSAQTAQRTSAQTALKKDTVNVGTITGLVRDSVHNYVMPSATLAIYKVKDNELVSYQLSNVYGKYQFKLMPVGVPLRIVVTHVGYMSAKTEFIISSKTKAIVLKTINMDRIDQSLKEVVISAAQAPMQMRGDTLEFNASAFKLDTTAVVEDLLRKLPGVTIWNDGMITVNGKTISKLLVDGKEFFASDNRIALQNIPKSSVQKVQVYQNKEDPDPITPKTEMNIVLKKNKKDGFFGKFGLGGGTQDHYAADGMITYFSPKTQVAVVGAHNNVNKSAYDLASLMSFNSFKGEGINSDYHSDFTRQGVNIFTGAGFTASHDFSKDSDPRQPYAKTNMLKGEYFLNDANNNTVRQSLQIIQLNSGDLSQLSNSTSTNDEFGQRGNASYNKSFLHSSIGSSVSFNNRNNTSTSTQTNNSVNIATGLLSSSNLEQRNSTSSSNNVSGEITYRTSRYWDNGHRKTKLLNMDLSYRFNLYKSDGDSKAITDFKAADATRDNYVNRHYLTDSKNGTHTFNLAFRDITGSALYRPKIFNIDVRNALVISDEKQTSDVGDLPLGGTTYAINTGLTNTTHLKTIDERPGLNFSRSFYKTLDNRYNKSFYFTVFAENQFFMQRNSALQSVQNISRSYYYFIPSSSITYYHYQYGNNSKTYSLNYSTTVDYPEIDQFAPLYDNTNSYSIRVGNLSLKPSYNEKLTFNYNYEDLATKHPFKTRLTLSGGMVKNSFSDNTFYDDLGRYVRSTINLGDRKYLNFSSSIDKTFKLKDHQFAFTTSPGTSYNRYLLNLNGETHETKTQTLNMSAVLVYSYKSICSAGFGEYFEGNKTEQLGLNRSTYYKWTTNFDLAFAFPRSIFFNTRVNFNNTKSSVQANNVYFTIWNADMGYRFLKGAEAEIKLSALDILHQNRSIYNSVYNNTITTTTANVLRQYFMITLAYYPRKFGLKK